MRRYAYQASEAAMTSNRNPPVGGEILADLVSAKEAAKLLNISESTAWRWINQQLLPAYRVGHKRVYVKRPDLAPLIKPARTVAKSRLTPDKAAEERMSEADKKRWLKALAESKRMRDAMLAERGGRPWIPSHVLLDEARDERSEQLA